jgi:hypothetical protein
MTESDLVIENSQLREELRHADKTIDSLRREIYDMRERHRQENILLQAQLTKAFETLCHIIAIKSPAPIILTKVIE